VKRILIACSMLAMTCAQAANEIRIGQTADFSSVASAQMKDFNAGANAAIAVVNARGGISGQAIKLVSLDDTLNADKAAANARQLIEKHNVMALFGSRGTDPSEAVMKVAEAHHVPLIAPITGADTVRKSKYTFPVRAAYRTEIEGILKHLSITPTRLAVLVQDDKFGNPLATFIDEQVKTVPSVQVVGKVRFARKDKFAHACRGHSGHHTNGGACTLQSGVLSGLHQGDPGHDHQHRTAAAYDLPELDLGHLRRLRQARPGSGAGQCLCAGVP